MKTAHQIILEKIHEYNQTASDINKFSLKNNEVDFFIKMMEEYKSQPDKPIEQKEVLDWRDIVKQQSIKNGTYGCAEFKFNLNDAREMIEAVSQAQTEVKLPKLHHADKSHRLYIDSLKQLNPNVKFV